MAQGELLDDCTWLYWALRTDYDTAAYFVRQGCWSQDQFEAFCAHHPYSAWSGRQIDARSEVGRLAMLLAGAIVNKKHGVPIQLACRFRPESPG
jgi:hypothetical protein